MTVKNSSYQIYTKFGLKLGQKSKAICIKRNVHLGVFFLFEILEAIVQFIYSNSVYDFYLQSAWKTVGCIFNFLMPACMGMCLFCV